MSDSFKVPLRGGRQAGQRQLWDRGPAGPQCCSLSGAAKKAYIAGQFAGWHCSSDSTKAQNNRATHLTPPEVAGTGGKERKQRFPRQLAAGVKFQRGTEFSPDGNRVAIGAGEACEERESKVGGAMECLGMHDVCIGFPHCVEMSVTDPWCCWF